MSNVEGEEVMFSGENVTLRKSFTNSSALAFARYNQLLFHLEITFQNGTVYRYKGVDPVTVNEFFKAESAGRFFQANILKGHLCERLK